jgi:hypothetical protein
MTPTPGLGRTILTYVAAGPPAGMVAFVAFMSIFEAATGGRPFELHNLVNGLPIILAFAYILGALPAIITSLVMASLFRRGWSLGAYLAVSAPVGAVSSCVALFWIILGPNSDIPKWVVITNFAVTGAVAAIVGTLALELLTPRNKVP